MIEANSGSQDESTRTPRDRRLVRLIKTIVETPEVGNHIDGNIINFNYFNAFNYNILTRGEKDLNLVLGVTSPKRRDGKTLVACNLAVSLATNFQRKTILVDLDFHFPQVHNIFGLPNSPGLASALSNGSIHVSRTAIEHLYVLPAGKSGIGLQTDDSAGKQSPNGSWNSESLQGLDRITSFRDVIYSLEREFEFIIVDMPAIGTDDMPTLFTSSLQGLLVVINQGHTKREDLEHMLTKINEQQIMGFVINRVQHK